MPEDRIFLMNKYPHQFTPGRQWENQEQINICKQIMFDIKTVLDKHKIRFWLAFGTFLGFYRDKDFIPWDGDIDLAVYSEDYDNIWKLEKEFTKLSTQPYESIGTCGRSIQIICSQGEHADLCFFDKVSYNKRGWSGFNIDIDDFETENYIQWEGESWRIVSNPEKWLKYTYGENWNKPVKGLIVSGPLGMNLI